MSYGFGKELSLTPRFIECRTYLGDEQLNNKQKRMCEPVDQMWELIRDGMFIKDVAISTAYYQDYTPEQAAEEGLKKLEAIKKLGMERPMMFLAGIHLTYVRLIEDILHIQVDMKQSAVISHIVRDNSMGLLKKWGNKDGRTFTEDQNKDFEADLLEVLVKCARQMKLKFVNRETMSQRLSEIRAEAMRVSEEYEKDAN